MRLSKRAALASSISENSMNGKLESSARSIDLCFACAEISLNSPCAVEMRGQQTILIPRPGHPDSAIERVCVYFRGTSCWISPFSLQVFAFDHSFWSVHRDDSHFAGCFSIIAEAFIAVLNTVLFATQAKKPYLMRLARKCCKMHSKATMPVSSPMDRLDRVRVPPMS